MFRRLLLAALAAETLVLSDPFAGCLATGIHAAANVDVNDVTGRQPQPPPIS